MLLDKKTQWYTDIRQLQIDLYNKCNSNINLSKYFSWDSIRCF